MLSSESVERSALTLQSVDNVESSDSLTACVLSVGDSIPDDILEEDLENSPGLLINEARDTLDASTTSQSADSRLGDALDVVSEHLPVPLGASLSCRMAQVLDGLDKVSCRVKKARLASLLLRQKQAKARSSLQRRLTESFSSLAASRHVVKRLRRVSEFLGWE